MQILILAPYPPYPPHGGGTMRIYQLIRGLVRNHQITCLTFVPDATADAALAPLREICQVQCVYGPPTRPIWQRAWTTLASPLPDMALRNASAEYSQALRKLLATQRFDVIQAESIEMVGYLAIARSAYPQPPLLVWDTFNVEYVLQKRAALTSLRAATAFRNPPSVARNLAGGIYSLAQWAKLAAYERQMLRQCDAVAVVSQGDRQLLQELAPHARLTIVPNGVDTSEFQRHQVVPHTTHVSEPQIVFSGTLDFRPNIDAVLWFAQEVLPLIHTQLPTARFVVVGRKPAPALIDLVQKGVLTLTGEVPDARPYIAGASVYVVPMRIGGGVRLKFLEALALETPIVSTSMGAEGIAGLRDGEHCLLADTPGAFAEALLRLLHSPTLGQQLGSAGRQLVQASYDWTQIVPRMEAAYTRSS